MYRIALTMLVGDKAKYLSLVLGLGFAVLLITQQTSIFFGLLLRGTGFLQNTTQPDLWVVDEHTTWIADLRQIDEDDLLRVRSVPGVAWAEPFFATRGRAELPDGSYQAVRLLGIDRSTLIGRPPQMVEGSIEDLRHPDAVIVEVTSRARLNGIQIGDRLKLNDQRAIVVGFARAELSFQSDVLIFTTYRNAVQFVPVGRDRLSMVFTGVRDPADLRAVQHRINQIPGIRAFTREQLQALTIEFILKQTGIGVNFAITVGLGLVVGLVVSGATFYQFTLENLRQFAVLKAMGATRGLLIRLMLMQAVVAGLIAFGIGVGAASIISWFGRKPGAELSTYFPWYLLLGSLGATLLCVAGGSILSVRRVLILDPATVFR